MCTCRQNQVCCLSFNKTAAIFRNHGFFVTLLLASNSFSNRWPHKDHDGAQHFAFMLSMDFKSKSNKPTSSNKKSDEITQD